MPDDKASPGQLSPKDWTSPGNASAAQIRLWLQSNVSTMKPVKVVAVYGPDKGALDRSKPSGIGYVDVQPLVRQMNSDGDTQAHGIIQKVPYLRSTGGKAAFIIDPKEGDIGQLVCADRDISSVKNNRGAESPPGSRRMFDPADGVYQGTFTGSDAAPDAYIFWKDDNHWLITPDAGATYIAIRPGEIAIFAKKIAVHAEDVLSLDVDGLGSESRPGTPDTYGDGVTGGHFPPHIPAVPNAEALKEK